MNILSFSEMRQLYSEREQRIDKGTWKKDFEKIQQTLVWRILVKADIVDWQRCADRDGNVDWLIEGRRVEMKIRDVPHTFSGQQYREEMLDRKPDLLILNPLSKLPSYNKIPRIDHANASFFLLSEKAFRLVVNNLAAKLRAFLHPIIIKRRLRVSSVVYVSDYTPDLGVIDAVRDLFEESWRWGKT